MHPAGPPPSLRVGAGTVHVVGTASGLADEGPRVTDFLSTLQPTVVALGVSPDEVEALRQFMATPEEELEDVEEAEYDPGYAQGLLQFGEILLPPPDLTSALEWASAANARVEGIDLPQHEYDQAFASNVGTLEVLFYGRKTRKLGKRPPKAATARDFVIAWDRKLRESRGVARVEALREQHMADRLAALAEGGASVVAVVAASREEGILQALAQKTGKSQK